MRYQLSSKNLYDPSFWQQRRHSAVQTRIDVRSIHFVHVNGRDASLGPHSVQWRHNGQEGASNHQRHHCLLTRLFGSRSKETSKLCFTGLCAGNSPVTGEFPAQMASNAENVSIWWRHHVGITLFLAWISNHIHVELWDDVIYLFPNFISAAN